jgi:uncharacterized protein
MLWGRADTASVLTCFEIEGGGWLFMPESRSARHPAISMAHGYAGVKEHGRERLARAFTEAGFVVLVHDHQNFGASDGAIRHDIDLFQTDVLGCAVVRPC